MQLRVENAKSDGFGDEPSFFIAVFVILIFIMTLLVTLKLLICNHRKENRNPGKQNGGRKNEKNN